MNTQVKKPPSVDWMKNAVAQTVARFLALLIMLAPVLVPQAMAQSGEVYAWCRGGAQYSADDCVKTSSEIPGHYLSYIKAVNAGHLYCTIGSDPTQYPLGLRVIVSSSTNTRVVVRYESQCRDDPWLYMDNAFSPMVYFALSCPVDTRWQPEYRACFPFDDRYRTGSPPRCDFCQGNPIFPLMGTKRETVDTGINIADLRLTLTYDSAMLAPRAEGAKAPPITPVPGLGATWSSTLFRRITSTGTNGALAVRGDGRIISFIGNAAGEYLPDADSDDRLQKVAGGFKYTDAAARAVESYDSVGQLLSITWASGTSMALTYSDASTPAAIAPAPGFLIRAQDDKGRSVNFQYSAAASLTKIVDASGQTTTLTQSIGNIDAIGWPDGTQRRFLYENPLFTWALTGVIDERSIRKATFGYDDKGRAISTEHTGGVHRYKSNYAVPPGIVLREEVDPVAGVIHRYHEWSQALGIQVEQPEGGSISVGSTPIKGRPYLTSRSQAAGSGCNASTRSASYDANGNLASEDDFNGTRTCYAYDLSRNTQSARIEGLVAGAVCSSLTPSGAALPAGTRKTTTAWHPDWRLVSREARPGSLSTAIYNRQVDPFAGAIASCAPSGAVTSDGKPIAVLCKKVEQATTDVDGSKGFDVAGAPATVGDPSFANVTLLLHGDGPDGSTTFIDSSSLGKVATAGGGARLSTVQSKFGGASMSFAGAGNYLIYANSADHSFGNGDFTVETWLRTNVVPGSGGQRIIASNYAGSNNGWTLQLYGSSIIFNVTGDGIDVQSAQGAIAANTWYHVAVTRQGSALRLFINGALVGNSTNSESSTSSAPLYIGRIEGYGSLDWDGYIDDLRITKGVARYTAAFAVPTAPFGNSTTSTAAIPSSIDTSVPNRVWTYTYNQAGQVLTAKGPRTDVNDTTTYEYYVDTTADHTVGDLKKVTSADGQVTQYTQYNKAGQVLRVVDANSVTTDYTYDARQRLKSVSTAGQTTSYDYLPSGQLKRVTQPDASYVEYGYDDAQRQVAVSDNLGNRIDYTLDNAGNRKEDKVKDPSGSLSRQVSRIMDALGRVQQVTGRE